ncbi:HAD family hydrolase [Palleronia sp. THAF1]|uniref:sulfotransferase-like domain-containing protein n=1 Tax=Palleronia sp. THAF1 TaxID=2587842 RepID=UPI0020C7A21E|nr:HAD family hydrolase [Palleronia sp. THAF1]
MPDLIAAWSGPRNLSTAMMYAFATRGDCAVQDEPFYAPFLARTGLGHPMRDTILARHETDPAQVVAGFDGGLTYLKLMAHHMKGMPLDWAHGARHLHLIRHPARVIASYTAKRERPSLDDIGFPQQRALFDRFGGVILDSADIRADPAGILSRACAALGLPYTDRMLEWPSGGHPSDGVWAAHWYGAVHASTGFADPEGPLPVLTGDATKLLERALPIYEDLYAQRLTPE